jgi:cell division protein FtsL
VGLIPIHPKEFISLALIFLSLLAVVWVHVEERRLGYELLKLSNQLETSLQRKSYLELEYAKLVRPKDLSEKAAQRLTLERLRPEQVIFIDSLYFHEVSDNEPMSELSGDSRGGSLE